MNRVTYKGAHLKCFFTDPCRVRSKLYTDVIRVNLFHLANYEKHVPHKLILGLHRERLCTGVTSAVVCRKFSFK